VAEPATVRVLRFRLELTVSDESAEIDLSGPEGSSHQILNQDSRILEWFESAELGRGNPPDAHHEDVYTSIPVPAGAASEQ